MNKRKNSTIIGFEVDQYFSGNDAMLLNFEFQQITNSQSKPTIVLIHGLFGSLSNLGVIARALESEYSILQIDVRNHGKSAHDVEMNYSVMAQDVMETLDHLNIEHFSVIGHSMGGKIAMKLTELAPQRLQNLIVLDMSPFAYQENHHDSIFKALFAVQQANIISRKEAYEIMQTFLKEDMVIQFLLKGFSKGQWLFNVQAIFDHYVDIIGWDTISLWSKPTLFIRGGRSPYISKDKHIQAIDQQFNHVELETIENAGHWLHAEQPNQITSIVKYFLNKN